VPCSASRVIPGAHRVVGPGTHRGSGPREVHTIGRCFNCPLMVRKMAGRGGKGGDLAGGAPGYDAGEPTLGGRRS
jgi:hypothetical protein